MTALISKDKSIVDKLALALDKSTKDLLDLNTKAVASEFLSKERAVEQIEILKTTINKFENYDLKGKKLLEIGAAVGTMLLVARNDYGIEAFGIEPSEDEFSSFKEVSNAIFEEWNMPKNILLNASGENLPFEDNSFDLIHSTNVIEHVNDPKKVLRESIRVL